MPDLGDIPRHLLEPMQRQLELLERLVEREQRLQRDITGQLVAPFDAVFDLLEESGATLARQADAMRSAGRALEEAAGLMKQQAALFERTIHTLRGPVELVKAVATRDVHPQAASAPTAAEPPSARAHMASTSRASRAGRST